ncbi:hypothetical protein BEP19_09565 [Ammoniphilus oxalaticus]|uniref:Peptidase S8/S53 domain-containing protein n=1 Tax=Ammoniphilus oxalaticus TaxID=66863 RepID=A0A419SKV4_9BACL|nr:S8 family peptidase [Ammoniphilus oxalaticus]RKD24612.1 hypothetical protein BEP19_09565 [Ammoniphilus oxalaticus]
MAKKREQEHLFLMYPNERQLLRCYDNLPKRAKRRLRLYARWHCLSLLKEDYETLKSRLLISNDQDEEQRITVESNIQFTLHDANRASKQTVPWGISRLQAPQVWTTSEGAGVKVGVIDTGINAHHPDLNGNVKGGVNTFNSTSPFVDDNGHGTHVAGTIAALNNSFGVVGMAPRAELYALKCFAPEGTADLVDIAQAIDWAIHHQVRVLNMSFGSAESSPVLHRAIKAALQAGIIMVASAGNSSATLDYPARYPEALAIGALDSQNRVASFSNYGKTLNYVAPGVDILSTWPVPPGYNTLSGTSMSAPHISGLCALLLAQNPELTPLQIKRLMDQAARRIPRAPLNKQGRGVVTASRLLAALSKMNKSSSSC